MEIINILTKYLTNKYLSPITVQDLNGFHYHFHVLKQIFKKNKYHETLKQKT